MFFYQLTLLSNNHILMSYLSGIYLESRFSWLWGRMQKTLRKKRKQKEEKHWKTKRKKNEEYKESKITTINIFGFAFYIKKYILLENIVWKKSSLRHHILFTVLCVAEYLKRSNNTPKLNIRKFTNYNMIETQINRLRTTTQIFITMDYLIAMSEKYAHFRKSQKHMARKFPPTT